MAGVLLVHGGLWEAIDADRFWVRPGVVDALRARGLSVSAPDRLHRPDGWRAEAEHLAASLPEEPVVLVGGSNGCSAAVRLAAARPGTVRGLVLAWPATAGDPRVDELARAGMASLGAPPATIDGLLAGGVLRGVDDAELATLRVPVAVLPSVPENPFHRRSTVDGLLRAVPGAVELPGCPEPPRPEFPAHLTAFCDAVVGFVVRA